MPRNWSFATMVLGAIVMLSAMPGAERLSDRSGAAPAHAELKDPHGAVVGRASLLDSPAGVLIRVTFDAAPPGVHAVHLHATGECVAPSFDSAGDHLNPTGARHGLLNARGPHAGDLPNVHVPADGRLEVEMLARGLAIDSGESPLLDADGTALVVHAEADDHRTDPAGAAGSRIACGVVAR